MDQALDKNRSDYILTLVRVLEKRCIDGQLDEVLADRIERLMEEFWPTHRTGRDSANGMPVAGRLRELIDRYWSLAHAEGKEGRDQDTEDGAAQQCRHEIEEILRGIDGAAPPDASDPA